MELRIIVAGSRDFDDYNYLCESLRSILTSKVWDDVDEIRIVSGGARGTDRLGEKYAKEHGLKLTIMNADWDTHGKSAGYKRNAEMAMYANADGSKGMLVAFWDGKSKGTKHMIDLARSKNMDVRVVEC